MTNPRRTALTERSAERMSVTGWTFWRIVGASGGLSGPGRVLTRSGVLCPESYCRLHKDWDRGSGLQSCICVIQPLGRPRPYFFFVITRWHCVPSQNPRARRASAVAARVPISRIPDTASRSCVPGEKCAEGSGLILLTFEGPERD
jgi:hypothetical protein